MTKPRRMETTACDTDNADLRARLHFCADTGQIWLHEHRMLLVHTEAQATLRWELIDTLGMDRARGFLARMGYAAGSRDFDLARTRTKSGSDLDVFMTGPHLHMLEGGAKVTPIKVQFDHVAGTFYGEFMWENSWEGQWHRHRYGLCTEPMCWSQIGYACGYTSAFMGRPILYKEVECIAMGASNFMARQHPRTAECGRARRDSRPERHPNRSESDIFLTKR